MIVSVYLLFVWFQAMPNDNVKTMHLLGVYDSRAGCERQQGFYRQRLMASADLSCVQWVIDR